MQRYIRIEPLSALFIQDHLRGSAMFFFAEALEALKRDGDRMAGVRVELFGDRVSGVHALNPGLAQGVLHVESGSENVAEFDRRGIYVLPETIADLPPVAGIISAGSGNPLSHVQLLARNLGIPNIVVETGLLDRLRSHAGEPILLAVSPAGSVILSRDDGGAGTRDTGSAAQAEVRIVPDLDKLDLQFRELVPLEDLTAADSGRIVGPKAAKLAELKRHYPEAVSAGLVIPFGVFRALLDQTFEDGPDTAFEWMVGEYRRLAMLPAGSSTRAEQTEAFRRRLEQWIRTADPGPGFREHLAAAMTDRFGEDGSYGVFVRSDTNVEDLPGFTGAGLNLTVPNVVGFEAVVDAVSRVWASPYSARAFAWRQSLMSHPEHVYPAVLLQETVNSDKSGVLVTGDIDTGDPGWLSVAVNEGVGGAVDGQPAESLRLEKATGRIRLLAQASTPWRREAPPGGGIVQVPVSGSDTVLLPQEAARLVEFALTLPQRFPPITDDLGQPVPADVEFGFTGGELRLFQIRPFLENRPARNHPYLVQLDAAIVPGDDIPIDLHAVPLY